MALKDELGEDEYKRRTMEAIDMAGRSGAKGLEMGYTNDGVPWEEAGWYAKAEFKSGTLVVDDQTDPLEAIEKLAARIQDKARCRWCSRLISWGPWVGNTRCAWSKVDGRWQPGCRTDNPETVPEAANAGAKFTAPPGGLTEHRLTEMGADDARALAKMPRKVPGQHRWIATAGYVVTEEQAAGGNDVILDHESRFQFGVGCIDCEQEFNEARGTPCPVGDDWGDDGPIDRTGADLSEKGQPRDDPKEAAVTTPPVGGRVLDDDDIRNVILANGIGVAVVGTGRRDDPETEIRLALSLTGFQNKIRAELHHLYMLSPEMAGLLFAQVRSIAAVFGAEFVDAYNGRIEELSKEGILGPDPFER